MVLLAAICTRLGFWQMDKLDQRLERNKMVTKHFAAEPVDLLAALPDGAKVDKTNEWTRVTATGTYDLDHELSIKFITRDKAPGADILTPLVLPSGEAVLVNRGWISTENNVTKPDAPAPPNGEVAIEGWLRKNTGAGRNATVPSEGQIRAISSDILAKEMPYDLTSGYINLQEQTPASSTPLKPEPKPELGQGPHFFYALQWWFFALLAMVGFFWFARVEAKERRNPTRIDGFTTPNAEEALSAHPRGT